jgi:hypothetical protein
VDERRIIMRISESSLREASQAPCTKTVIAFLRQTPEGWELYAGETPAVTITAAEDPGGEAGRFLGGHFGQAMAVHARVNRGNVPPDGRYRLPAPLEVWIYGPGAERYGVFIAGLGWVYYRDAAERERLDREEVARQRAEDPVDDFDGRVSRLAPVLCAWVVRLTNESTFRSAFRLEEAEAANEIVRAVAAEYRWGGWEIPAGKATRAVEDVCSRNPRIRGLLARWHPDVAAEIRRLSVAALSRTYPI